MTLRALFTKVLTTGLIRELCNQLDDWLDKLILTNHRACYIIRSFTRELKIDEYGPYKAIFKKFLTPKLTRKLRNLLDDWLGRLIPTNRQAGYLICRLIRELKIR